MYICSKLKSTPTLVHCMLFLGCAGNIKLSTRRGIREMSSISGLLWCIHFFTYLLERYEFVSSLLTYRLSKLDSLVLDCKLSKKTSEFQIVDNTTGNHSSFPGIHGNLQIIIKRVCEVIIPYILKDYDINTSLYSYRHTIIKLADTIFHCIIPCLLYLLMQFFRLG